MSVRVDRLLKAELIEPGEAQEDGRNRPVRLTDKGSNLWREATEERTTREGTLYTDALSKEDLEQLNALLSRLLASFESELGERCTHRRIRAGAG